MAKRDLRVVDDGPPADFGVAGGPDIEGMLTYVAVTRLQKQLEKAEAFLATIAGGKCKDPQYHAAKYWGSYKDFDKAMERNK